MKRKAEGRDLTEGLLLPDTELIIDGFQGSANSFAVAAFKGAQTRRVRLMHHRHAPVLLIRAIEREIPVLLTIREPVSTVLSLTSRWSHISITQGLRSYIGFYSTLKPYSSHYIVSTFERTIQHLDRVVRAVNAKFGTDFDEVDVVRANLERERQVSTILEQVAKRENLKKEKRQALILPHNTRLLAQARELYQTFEEFAQQAVKL